LRGLSQVRPGLWSGVWEASDVCCR
jgi:hypothetical protein